MQACTAVECATAADDQEAGNRGAPEVPPAEEGGHDHQREELGEDRSGPAVLVLSPQQQCQAKQTDSDRVHVAVIGEGPQGQRVPGVDKDPLSRQPGERQQPQQADDADGLKAEHDQAHARDVVRDPAGHCEHDLREGRIDRPRVARAVDLRVDNWIAQESQCGVRGNVSIRIDTCRLHAAIPD